MGYSAGRFFRDLDRAARQAKNAYIRSQRDRERIEHQNQRDYEQQIRQKEREFIADEHRRQKLYIESRIHYVNQLNSDQEKKFKALDNLLLSCLNKKVIIEFRSLFIVPEKNLEDYGNLAIVIPEPTQKKLIFFYILRIFSWIKPIKVKFLNFQKAQKDRHLKNLAAWNITEQKRIKNLDEKKIYFKQIRESEQKRVDTYNNNIVEWEKSCELGERLALSNYYEHLLLEDIYPEGFPNEVMVNYAAASKMLIIQYSLPELNNVIPTEKLYKYTKTTDSISSTSLPEKQRKEIYSKVVAANAIRVLNTVFQDKYTYHIQTITLNCHVKTIDLATGKKINPCLLSTRVTQEQFGELDLEHVDPVMCLKELRASISASPSELLPVRPIIEFNMNDPRFISGSDILSELDARPNLMDLNPTEFEALITNLFQAMGLETKLTRASRDGGIDCVAYDPRPVLGGKVVVQAKRYKNTVGVSAVRDLSGAMDHERASKGILVTTSGYGKASFEFANGKPIELLDGQNLLYLLKEHTGIDAKIIMPAEEG
jgi:restriction system protein